MTPHLRYTAMAWALIPLIDQGEVLALSATSPALRDRTLFDLLEHTYGDKFSLAASILPDAERAEILRRFADMPSGREFDVQSNGLVLLLAYCIEMIQQVVVQSNDRHELGGDD